MRMHTTTTALAALLAIGMAPAIAQEDLAPDPAYTDDIPSRDSVMNLTFSAEGTTGCGLDSDHQSNAFTLSILSVPGSRVCFNVQTLLESPNNTYLEPIEPCPAEDPRCGVEYQLHGIPEGGQQRNTSSMDDDVYGQVYYQQRPLDGDGAGEHAGLFFSTFPGFECTAEEGDEDEEWRSWTCGTGSEGDCANLGNGALNSFAIQALPEGFGENSARGCLLAAQEGAGVAIRSSVGGSLVLIFFVGVLLVI